MSAIWAICRRDLLFLFTTPLAWLLLAAWTFVTNLVFQLNLVEAHSQGFADAPLYLSALSVGTMMLVLLAPAITMNSFAAEQSQGSFQLLLTVPITEWQLVLGKFLACFAMLLALVVATLPQPLVLALVSETGGPQLWAGYLSLVLAALVYAALGTWISLLVESPVASYVITMAIIAVLYLIGLLADPHLGLWEPLAFLGRVVGIDQHLAPMRRGELRLVDLVWLLSAATACLAMAQAVLRARRIHG